MVLKSVDIPSISAQGIPSILKWIVVGLVALFLVKSAVIFVPPGKVGVVYDRGRGVLPNGKDEGAHILIPFWQTIFLVDTRIQEYTMAQNIDEGAVRRDDSLDAPTSDGQQVKVDATILFRIDKSKAPKVFQTIGPDYANKIVRTFTRSQIRMVISRYTAPAIYSEKRQEAEQTMTQELIQLLADKDIVVDKVLLRAVYFSDEYSQAIENKVIAEQKVKQAEYEVQVASQQAQAKIAEAKGLAEAQQLQKQSLTQEFLQLEAIKKWDGKLPQVTGGNSPFINIPLR